MKTKLATIGTLVKIYPLMANALAISARVQDHLTVQFTYSKPDDDTVIGICRFDGDFEDDYETIDTRKPEQTATESPGEFEEEDQDGSEVLDRPWLHEGRRRKRAKAVGN